jgi:hypothetical protein
MRRVVALLSLFLFAATGCTQGTTPDCSTVQCGPNLDGTVGDAPSDAAVEASDSGLVDTGIDAPADAPNDGG